MKTVVPDIVDVVTTRYISQVGRLNKFKRFWGTETVNGIEVLKGRHVFYPSMSPETEKLGEFLGALSSMKAKPEGAKMVWLYLNASKADDSIIDLNKAVIVENLNRVFKDLVNATIAISPKVSGNSFISPPVSAGVTNQPAIIAELIARYREYWENDFQITTNASEGYVAILLSYVLRSQDLAYTIKQVDKVVTSYTYHTPTGKRKTLNGDKYRIVVDVPKVEITGNTDIVDMMIADMTEYKYTTSKLIKTLLFSANDPAAGDTAHTPIPVSTSSFWVKLNGRTYLRASFLSNTAISRENKIKYLYNLIDYDYRKKDFEWYEVAAAILVIAAITYFSAGAGTAAAAAFTSGAMVAVVTISVAITVASMYIALTALALNYLGAPNVSAAMGVFQRQIAPLVRIASVISTFAIIYRAVQVGLEKATAVAAQEAAERGVQEGVRISVQVAIKEITIELTKVVITTLTGMPTTEKFQVQHALKAVDLAFGLYQKNELGKINRDIEWYRQEIAEQQQLAEASQVSDLVKDMMAAYPNPIAKDQSEYSGRYDKPYEWWSTEFHTGNIQATTVSALWLEDA